jgi:hypothetical protein
VLVSWGIGVEEQFEKLLVEETRQKACSLECCTCYLYCLTRAGMFLLSVSCP